MTNKSTTTPTSLTRKQRIRPLWFLWFVAAEEVHLEIRRKRYWNIETIYIGIEMERCMLPRQLLPVAAVWFSK